MNGVSSSTLGCLLFVLCPVVVQAGGRPVALQTADPSCRDDSGNIYVDCGNGTVTDNRTGLVWLKNASCASTYVSWHDAMEFVEGLGDIDTATCSGLGLTEENCDCSLHDGSSPGEWRLPSASEWKAMVANAKGVGGDPDCTGAGDVPTITNDDGTDCWKYGSSSFTGVEVEYYWSSTTIAGSALNAGYMNLSGGSLYYFGKDTSVYVWPVRGGQ